MDYSRQSKLIDPTDLKNKSITLVGAGATGSYVAMCLAQMGVGNKSQGQGILRVFDGDVIEAHNISNQIYEPSHIGMPKVDALKEIVYRKCGFTIDVYNEMVTEASDARLIQSNYVFLLTDTMKSRKEIFDKFLQYSFKTDLVIETRMGLTDGRVYAFNPNSLNEKEEWINTLYTDKEAETSVCGASSSIITTAMYISALACQRFIEHFSASRSENPIKGEMWNEVHFSLYPENHFMRRFGQNPVIAQ